jgi:cytochrome d ubiquinol oxidase subunit II
MLPLLSAGFGALALTLYVLLDGFDLGVGILLLVQPRQELRNHMVDAITPTWDGNETWLILAGVTLLAAFPLAYGILLPALYLPLIVMLLSLGLRGVSFEFRVQTILKRQFWDRVFATGSLLAALAQGVVVGTLLQGVSIRGVQYAGSAFDFLSPLSALSAAALTAGYMILGAGWLFLKGNRIIESFAKHSLHWLVPVFALLCAAAIGYGVADVAELRGAVYSHRDWLVGLGVGLLGVLVLIPLSTKHKSAIFPFLLGMSLFLIGIVAVAIVVFPDIIPFRVSIWEASSSRLSQVFLLIGAVIVTPVVMGYSLFAYWVFRGKTQPEGWES